MPVEWARFPQDDHPRHRRRRLHRLQLRPRLAATAATSRVVNLDTLTYAGNLENLASLEGDPRHVFVHGDIGDRGAGRRLLAAAAARGRALRRREPRRPQHPRRRPSSAPTSSAPHAARGARARRKRRRRFLHVSTDEVYGSLGPTDAPFTETHALRAQQPVLGQQGGQRPPGARLAPHLRPAGADHQLLQQLRPLSFPEKLIPLMIVNALGRQAAAGLRRRPAGARLAVREGPLRAPSARCSTRGRVGETYNIGGWNEKRQHRDRAHDLRAARRAAPRTDGPQRG